MIFENPQIETDQLPSIENIEFQKLAPTYKKTEYIGTTILFGFLLIGVVILFFKLPVSWGQLRWGAFVVWALLFAMSMYLAGRQYDMAGYALREKDIVHKSGVWWHNVTTIPFNRMQHCEISRGPVQNAFGLATLRVFTAGGTSSDLSIDGLEHEEAMRIRDFVTGKINRNEYEKPGLETVDDEIGPANTDDDLSDEFKTIDES